MPNINIEYQIYHKDTLLLSHKVELEADTLNLVTTASDPPSWAQLECKQCKHCPLSSATHPYCPVALCVVDISPKLEQIASYDEVVAHIKLPERNVSITTSIQRVISSLLGLLFACSGCPHMAFFKPMARFHLPLASEEDTLFRAAGMYLIAQYLSRKNGLDADWDLNGLSQIYKNVKEINKKIAERIRASLHSDAPVNAVILLDLLASFLPSAIEEKLSEIEPIFAPYLDEKSRSLIDKQTQTND